MAREDCNERRDLKTLGTKPETSSGHGPGLWSSSHLAWPPHGENHAQVAAAAAGPGPGEEPATAAARHGALVAPLPLQKPPPAPVCSEPVPCADPPSPAPAARRPNSRREPGAAEQDARTLRDRAPGNATPGTAQGAAARRKEKLSYFGRPFYCFLLQLTAVLRFLCRSWVLIGLGGLTPAPNGTGVV